MNAQPIIKVENISKSFTSTKALNNVSFEVFPGQVRGLIGENGSGKSTISSIISGNLDADSGDMYFYGQPYKPQNSFEASEQGITMIIQEQGTIATISAGANIFAGREKKFCKNGILNSKELNKEAKELLVRVGASHIDPETVVSKLSLEDRKLVEIARAFYKLPEIFIVDETTTALPQSGREVLYKLIRMLKEKGKVVLFISHDIDEVMQVCDSVTILRDGQYIITLSKEEMEPSRMKSLMVGREVMDNFYRSDTKGSCAGDEEVLKLEDVNYGILKDINLTLKKGEILGIGGLTDCGMHELGKIAFGRIRPHRGRIIVNSKVPIQDTYTAIKQKVGYVSKNRDTEALLASGSIKDNVVLPSLDMLKKVFFITKKSEKKLAGKWCSALGIKMRDMDQSCNELSGGNKQKVVLAKWLGNESDILVLDCPTRGIDIGVKEAIYRIMENLKAQGKSILMISEELPEVIGMSDRILIMKDGKIVKEFQREDNQKESDLIQYMI